MTLTERFLRARHWQLFVLIVGAPIIFQTYMMISIFSKLAASGGAPPDNFMAPMFAWMPVILIISGGTLMGWFWSIATGLQPFVPAGVRLKVNRFKIFFIIPIVYTLVICVILFFFVRATLTDPGASPDTAVFLGFVAIILPVHFFSIFCIFYVMYFVAKTLRTVELQHEARFSEFAGEFVLIWFYFVGVWMIQPRVNKIVRNGAPQISRGADILD